MAGPTSHRTAPPPPHPRKPLPSLPRHIWSRILSLLTTPTALATAAQTTYDWHTEISSPHFDHVWRRVWDLQSKRSSESLLQTPWNLLSPWRRQVLASHHLQSIAAPGAGPRSVGPRSVGPRSARLIFVPPRYQTDGTPSPEDRLAGVSSSFDVLDVFGRAVVTHAFAESVLIAFEYAVALIRRPPPLRARSARKAAPSPRPSLHYDNSSPVQGIFRFSPLKSKPSVLAITSCSVLCIDVHTARNRAALSHTVLETFLLQHGLPTTVASSSDDKYALVGFDSGIIKVIEIEHPSRKNTLLLREGIDILVANEKYAVACSSMRPIALRVWNLSNGACLLSFTQASEGWESVDMIAALCPLTNVNRFLLWHGGMYTKLSTLHISFGMLLPGIDVCSSSRSDGVPGEEENDSESVQTGICKLALLADEKDVVLSTSHRAIVVSLSSHFGMGQKEFYGPRGALLALSTDDRVFVSADGNAFGRLGMQVSGRASLASSPKMQVWNIDDGELKSEIRLPSTATSLSVCADIVAVVCGSVGKAVILFAGGL